VAVVSARRVDWLDLARGIGIVLVVAGHAERGLVAAGIARDTAWHLFDLGIYTFHMPLFMVLAGLNVPGSLRRGRRVFLMAKLWTIAWPYLLWSLVQGVLGVELAGVTNGHAQWAALAAIAWQPISPFWFLYALMVFMGLAVLVSPRLYLLVPLALAGAVASLWSDGETIGHQLCYQIGFFAVGVLAAAPIRALDARMALVILPLAVALWCAAFVALPQVGNPPYLHPASLPAAWCGIAAVLALSRLLARSALLISLGRASMTIYVLHILGTAGARAALIHMHLPPQPFVYWTMCTAAGLGLPWLAHQGLGHLGLLPLLGLGPRNAPAAASAPVIFMEPIRG
jgi:fucose 4-O-acetylase-like acetyltransferase